MSRVYGNYRWVYCEIHGRYAVVGANKGCPKCKKENEETKTK